MTNKLRRGAGVLCHISTLPNKYGMGTLGKEAQRFAKLLAKSKVKYWEVGSCNAAVPEASPFDFGGAGDPALIDLDLLLKDKLLKKEELKFAKSGREEAESIDRISLLRIAFSRFNFDGKVFRTFIKGGSVEGYALYETARLIYGENVKEWPEAIRASEPAALEEFRTEYHEEYLFWNFVQYEFNKQWSALKKYVKLLGVKMISSLSECGEISATKVLFEAFERAENEADLPHAYTDSCACYTDMVVAESVSERLEGFSVEEFILLRSRIAAELERFGILVKLGVEGEGLPEALIRLALASNARLAIIPVIDILQLDSVAHLNRSVVENRLHLIRQPSALTMGRLKKMIKLYRR